jgi:phosphoglycolate phosphatase
VTVVLLDLDGTLSDSKPGISASLRYTVGQLGHDPDAAGDLTWAVGPPIAVSIRRLLEQYGDDRVDQAVGIYRACYSDVGIYGCTVYPGIAGMLDALRDGGTTMYVATSKRRDFADRVIDYLSLRSYVRGVYGALPGGGLDDKQDLLAHILSVEGVAATDAVMVGDRMHDMHAARHNDIRPIGVLWGYGGMEELLAAGAAAVAAEPADVVRLVPG